MGRITKRDAAAIILIALVCGIVSGIPPFSLIHGWSIDVLTALRWEAFGVRRAPGTTPVVVIAIDDETYQTPPFKGSPTVTWTTEVGRVLNAVIDGGAKVVGFDIVFSASIEQSELPFGDDLLGFSFLSEISQHEQRSGKALFAGVEELIHQVRFYPDRTLQHVL